PERVRAAAMLGQAIFGESRVQEAKAKIEQCPGHLRWHLIGHLQSNKCRDAVALFQMIESIDSLALAQELNKWAEKEAKTYSVLLEVNVAGEATKFGFQPEQLLSALKPINALPRIEIHGLMTIAPWTPEPEKVQAPSERHVSLIRYAAPLGLLLYASSTINMPLLTELRARRSHEVKMRKFDGSAPTPCHPSALANFSLCFKL